MRQDSPPGTQGGQLGKTGAHAGENWGERRSTWCPRTAKRPAARPVSAGRVSTDAGCVRPSEGDVQGNWCVVGLETLTLDLEILDIRIRGTDCGGARKPCRALVTVPVPALFRAPSPSRLFGAWPAVRARAPGCRRQGSRSRPPPKNK